MDMLISILICIGLAASAGLRVFLPMLILSVFAKLEWIELAAKFDWLDSNPALIMLSVATIIEMISLYIPIVDQFLKTIATPLAAASGVLLTIAMIGDMDPLFSCSFVVFGGGTIAVVTQLVLLTLRWITTFIIFGIGNIFYNFLEGLLSIVLIILSIIFPFFVLFFIGVVIYLFIKFFIKRNKLKGGAVS